MRALRKILLSLFFLGPVAVLVAALNLLYLIVVLVPVLLLWLLEWLVAFLRRMSFKEEELDDLKCDPPLPEPVMRRPDPCIYSQQHLAAQGVPVTWNNPDIWVARASSPEVIEPDSYHLEADVDYIVTVQAHNASTDLALGVKVRLLYRPWSFNSPDLIPVETNVKGREVVQFVNIPGMGSALAQFNWRTPAVSPGESRHFCLQAHLSHPLDLNLENNMGQENTNVYSANPGHVTAGELVDVEVPLFNHSVGDARFTFDADAYAVNESSNVELELDINQGTERWPLKRALASYGPVLRRLPRQPTPLPGPELSTRRPGRRDEAGPRLAISFRRRERYSVNRARYRGHDSYRRQLLDSDFSLPEGMTFERPGGADGLAVGAAQIRAVPIRLQVPSQARTGDRYSINVRATTDDGRLIGGVTFLLEVEN